MADAASLRWRFATGACAGAVALILKQHYATASAEDLRWVLAPTVRVLETVTGAPFSFESGEGYLSPEMGLLVAPSCAGVNFLIAALCTGVLAFLDHARGARGTLAVLFGAGIAAYALTVATNASRLVLGAWLVFLPAELGWSAASVHRVQGVTVYFTVLCLAYLAAIRMLPTGPAAAERPKDSTRASRGQP